MEESVVDGWSDVRVDVLIISVVELAVLLVEDCVVDGVWVVEVDAVVELEEEVGVLVIVIIIVVIVLLLATVEVELVKGEVVGATVVVSSARAFNQLITVS